MSEWTARKQHEGNDHRLAINGNTLEKILDPSVHIDL